MRNGHPQKDPNLVFKTKYPFNAGQKYCRMLQGVHSAIPLTCIKLPFVIKIFVLSISELLFYTGLTVHVHALCGGGNFPYQYSDSVDFQSFSK